MSKKIVLPAEFIDLWESFFERWQYLYANEHLEGFDEMNEIYREMDFILEEKLRAAERRAEYISNGGTFKGN